MWIKTRKNHNTLNKKWMSASMEKSLIVTVKMKKEVLKIIKRKSMNGKSESSILSEVAEYFII
jgi:hypothetical protein